MSGHVLATPLLPLLMPCLLRSMAAFYEQGLEYSPSLAKACFPNAEIRCARGAEPNSHVCAGDNSSAPTNAKDMVSTCSDYNWDAHTINSFQCSADKGIIAGIVLVTLVIIGCCVGLRMQPAPEPGDTTTRRITFSSRCVGMWMCPLICLLLALIPPIVLFHLFPEICLTHEIVLTLKPEVMPYFLM